MPLLCSDAHFRSALAAFRRRWTTFGVSVVVACFSTSCTESKLDVFPVSGTVTLDGKPLNEGTIIFTPADKQLGPEGGKIREGSFSLQAKAGSNRVEINSSRISPDKFVPGTGLPMRESIVPSKYNKQSILTVEVERETNRFDFPLESEAR